MGWKTSVLIQLIQYLKQVYFVYPLEIINATKIILFTIPLHKAAICLSIVPYPRQILQFYQLFLNYVLYATEWIV